MNSSSSISPIASSRFSKRASFLLSNAAQDLRKLIHKRIATISKKDSRQKEPVHILDTKSHEINLEIKVAYAMPETDIGRAIGERDYPCSKCGDNTSFDDRSGSYRCYGCNISCRAPEYCMYPQKPSSERQKGNTVESTKTGLRNALGVIVEEDNEIESGGTGLDGTASGMIKTCSENESTDTTPENATIKIIEDDNNSSGGSVDATMNNIRVIEELDSQPHVWELLGPLKYGEPTITIPELENLNKEYDREQDGVTLHHTPFLGLLSPKDDGGKFETEESDVASLKTPGSERKKRRQGKVSWNREFYNSGMIAL